MAKFGINDILNAKSKAGAAANTTERYTEIYLSPYEVKAAEENTHQKLDGIEELADSFLHVGQEQPTILARINGEYWIIDGHRRNAANILNLERGYKEYEKVLYRYRDMTPAMYELSLLAGNGYTQELTAYEKTRLVERTKAALIRAKKEDGLEIRGKMRDLIAAMIGESCTNVARMENINNNAIPEIKEQLKDGNIGITAAYEAAKLTPEQQKEIAAEAAAEKGIRAKEIAEKVANQSAAKTAEKNKESPKEPPKEAAAEPQTTKTPEEEGTEEAEEAAAEPQTMEMPEEEETEEAAATPKVSETDTDTQGINDIILSLWQSADQDQLQDLVELAFRSCPLPVKIDILKSLCSYHQNKSISSPKLDELIKKAKQLTN